MSTTPTPDPAAKPGSLFIAVFDDEQGVICPMRWDEDNPGGLCGGGNLPVAVFLDRESARRAIRISAAFATLAKLRGHPANTDVLPEYRKFIRIVPAATAKPNAATR